MQGANRVPHPFGFTLATSVVTQPDPDSKETPLDRAAGRFKAACATIIEEQVQAESSAPDCKHPAFQVMHRHGTTALDDMTGGLACVVHGVLNIDMRESSDFAPSARQLSRALRPEFAPCLQQYALEGSKFGIYQAALRGNYGASQLRNFEGTLRQLEAGRPPELGKCRLVDLELNTHEPYVDLRGTGVESLNLSGAVSDMTIFVPEGCTVNFDKLKAWAPADAHVPTDYARVNIFQFRGEDVVAAFESRANEDSVTMPEAYATATPRYNLGDRPPPFTGKALAQVDGVHLKDGVLYIDHEYRLNEEGVDLDRLVGLQNQAGEAGAADGIREVSLAGMDDAHIADFLAAARSLGTVQRLTVNVAPGNKVIDVRAFPDEFRVTLEGETDGLLLVNGPEHDVVDKRQLYAVGLSATLTEACVVEGEEVGTHHTSLEPAPSEESDGEASDTELTEIESNASVSLGDDIGVSQPELSKKRKAMDSQPPEEPSKRLHSEGSQASQASAPTRAGQDGVLFHNSIAPLAVRLAKDVVHAHDGAAKLVIFTQATDPRLDDWMHTALEDGRHLYSNVLTRAEFDQLNLRNA